MDQPVKYRSIRTKLTRTVVGISLLSILLLGAVALTGILQMRAQTLKITNNMGEQAATNSRELLEREALSQLDAIASAKAETVDARLQGIMSQVDILAGSAEELYARAGAFGRIPIHPADATTKGTFTAQIVYSNRTNPSRVADEVGLIGNLTGPMKQASAYLAGVGTTQYGSESGFILMCDENAHLKVNMGALEPTERGWYRMAADSGAITWSEVFEDAYGRGLAVTCGKPVYGPNGALKGVVSIGSQLNDISATVTSTAIGKTGYAFVVDQSGAIIMSKQMQTGDNGAVILKNLLEDNETSVREAAGHMVSGESGMAQVTWDGKEVYMAYQPMQNLSWSVVAVVAVDEVLASAVQGQQEITVLSDTAGTEISQIIFLVSILFLAAFALITALAVGLSTTFAKRLTTPLSELSLGVSNISGGDLETRLELQTGDEIEGLAQAFNEMTESLKHYIKDLTAVTAEKERIGAELDVATHIQASMLPCIFPAFPERAEFDIYASMQPAKEVGGDFYDFFLVDDDHLAMVIADVSGKGVPAALFMVIAKTLIKDHAQTRSDPAAVFTEVNQQLCQSNDEGLFVTAWMGVLEISTGQVVFVNAGHNPPLARHEEGGFDYLQMRPGFVLAGMEDMRYRTGVLKLHPGDALYLYTDGVTEATDTAEELYGEERLKRVLDQNKGAAPTELLPIVKADIDLFVGQAPQFDDITMLGLHYHGAAAVTVESENDEGNQQTTLL